jgi:hypothetical protein
MAERAIWNEAREIATYHPGQKVEIKHLPGTIDTVIAYDPMMVPPIVLASDPQPRYPEELILISQSAVSFDWLRPWSKAVNNRAILDRTHLIKA